jgi:hypothetical protein
VQASTSRHPRGHATLALHDRRFQWVHQFGAHVDGQRQEQVFVHQKTIGAVWQVKTAALDALDAVLEPDRRGQPAEQQSAWTHGAPGPAQHGEEVRLIAGEVQDGAADHHVRAGSVEAHRLDRPNRVVAGRCGASRAAIARTAAMASGRSSAASTSCPVRRR